LHRNILLIQRLFLIQGSPNRVVAVSMDSDLEAFSHNPMDGSFAALASHPTTLPIIQTNGSSRTKLDYCRNNVSSVG
jgi:hypothetical protein